LYELFHVILSVEWDSALFPYIDPPKSEEDTPVSIFFTKIGRRFLRVPIHVTGWRSPRNEKIDLNPILCGPEI